MRAYAEYPRYLVAVDLIIFGYDIDDKELKLIIVERDFEPAKGQLSLAGGFVQPNESLEMAACRVLKNLTGMDNVFMRQLHCYGDVDRDSGARVISVAYWALIKLKEIDNGTAAGHGARWQSIRNLPRLVFDHQKMVARALAELRLQIKNKPSGFELLPRKFTLVQLQELYEAIYLRHVDKRNFRKKILSMDILERLEEKDKERSRKGAYYYRFLIGDSSAGKIRSSSVV
jgi:hypothetical protein